MWMLLIRPMLTETWCCKVLFPTYFWKENRAGKNGGKNVLEKIICSRGCTRRSLCFHLKIVNTLIENSSHDDRPSIYLDVESTHGQPASCRARPMNVNEGLGHIRWICGLGGERLPAASCALLPHLKNGLVLSIGEGSRLFGVCFLHTSGQLFL